MPENTAEPQPPTGSHEPAEPGEPDQPKELEEYDVSFTVAGSTEGCRTFVDGPTHTVDGRELWVLSIAFYAHDPVHAMTMARHATRRVATVFPRFDKNGVGIMRQSTYGTVEPLYCDLDVYCVQPPHHTGPCRSQDGRNLDDYNPDTDPAPELGAEI